MNPLLGILLMAIGSAGAASFYVPIRKVKKWSWESYWLVQGLASWLIAPWIFSLLTVQELNTILSEVPLNAKLGAMVFGALWGIGGLTFGLSMRYLGVALGQSIALGFCAAFGTLIPPVVSGENLFSSTSGILMLIGVAICIGGIAVIGYAGALKSKNMDEEERKKAVKEFALKKGLIISVVAGVMSACMNYGINGIEGVIDAGNVFQETAKLHHVNELYISTPALIYVLLGGLITNFSYCIFLNIKNKTYKDYYSVTPLEFINNISFSFLGGTLWFLQFFFFGMGQSYLPENMQVFGWSILMALNISFANIWGLILNEWKGAGKRAILTLVAGIIILIISTFVVNF